MCFLFSVSDVSVKSPKGTLNPDKLFTIKSDGFEIEPEITAKISKNKKLNIYEIPITIYSRGYDEGKKVKLQY